MLTKDKLQLTKKWDSIILFREVISYLDMDTILEVSLTTKLTRKKLAYILFSSINLYGRNLDSYYYSCYGEFNLDEYDAEGIVENLASKQPEDTDRLTILQLIQTEIDQLSKDFAPYPKLVKKANIVRLNRLSYSLFPIVLSCTNLNTLNLINCTISWKDFTNLCNSLICVENLKMQFVSFISFPFDEPVDYSYEFPKNLKKLYLSKCKLYKFDKWLPKTEIGFDKSSILSNPPFYLPLTHISTLKELCLTFYECDQNLCDFLFLNLQLSKLSLMSNILNQSILDFISNSRISELSIDNSDYIRTDYDGMSISTLGGINSLTILGIGGSYDLYINIISSCINLEILNLSTNDHQYDIEIELNGLLEMLSNKTKNLKKLIFNPVDKGLFIINWSLLSNIEYLVIDISKSEYPRYDYLLVNLATFFSNFNEIPINLTKFDLYFSEDDAVYIEEEGERDDSNFNNDDDDDAVYIEEEGERDDSNFNNDDDDNSENSDSSDHRIKINIKALNNIPNWNIIPIPGLLKLRRMN